jgi:hypothetical protein
MTNGINIYLMRSWHEILRLPPETPENQVREAIAAHVKKCQELPTLIKRQRIGNATLCSYYLDIDHWNVWVEY